MEWKGWVIKILDHAFSLDLSLRRFFEITKMVFSDSWVSRTILPLRYYIKQSGQYIYTKFGCKCLRIKCILVNIEHKNDRINAVPSARVMCLLKYAMTQTDIRI